MEENFTSLKAWADLNSKINLEFFNLVVSPKKGSLSPRSDS